MRQLLLSVFILHSVLACAQRDTIREKMVADSLIRLRYVDNTRNLVTIYVYASRLSNGVLYSGHSNLFYYPITPVNLGIGMSHKWLGGSISIVSIQSSKSKLIDNYNFNIGVNAYGRQIGADLVYTYNRGYYLSNYRSFGIDDVDKSQPYYSMRMQRVMLNFVRIFNGKKYSLDAPVGQGEIQKKNSSSFLINMGVGLTYADNGDSSFVPAYLYDAFSNSAILEQGAFYSLNCMPGYGVTWVLKHHFFIGLVPSAGISLQYQRLYYHGKELEEHIRASYKVLGRFGIGYHSDKWTAGVSLILDAESFPLGNGTFLVNNVGKVHARVGYKLDVPKWAKKYSRKMDSYQERLEHALPIY